MTTACSYADSLSGRRNDRFDGGSDFDMVSGVWLGGIGADDTGMAYDLSKGGDRLRVRTHSTLDLEQQIHSGGATWLHRDLVSSDRMHLIKSDFGYDVARAIDRRCERLLEMGHATREPNRAFMLPRDLVATLERQEVERIGQELARHAA